MKLRFGVAHTHAQRDRQIEVGIEAFADASRQGLNNKTFVMIVVGGGGGSFGLGLCFANLLSSSSTSA